MVGGEVLGDFFQVGGSVTWKLTMKLADSWGPWVAEVLAFLGLMSGVELAGVQVSLRPRAAVP